MTKWCLETSVVPERDKYSSSFVRNVLPGCDSCVSFIVTNVLPDFDIRLSTDATDLSQDVTDLSCDLHPPRLDPQKSWQDLKGPWGCQGGKVRWGEREQEASGGRRGRPRWALQVMPVLVCVHVFWCRCARLLVCIRMLVDSLQHSQEVQVCRCRPVRVYMCTLCLCSENEHARWCDHVLEALRPTRVSVCAFVEERDINCTFFDARADFECTQDQGDLQGLQPLA